VTCGTLLPDAARFCPSCGTAVDSAPAPVADDGGEERKVISVLFADLVGFTASSDGADPEDVRRRVQPFHTAIREAVEGFGGKIEKLMGDGVLAVFGVPTVHEDDAERAVRAALEAQERVAQVAGSNRLQARIAIGTGEAVVRVDGATADQEGILGDVINTASRLQGEAQPGTVLVDEATHRATRRAMQYDERPPVAVKGKSEPLAVWVAVEPIARLGADISDDGATFVGRSSELSLLIEWFSRSVEDRTSQVVTIAGEPGVGKSRLVRELRRHISELPDLIRWRQGRCLPYGEGITFWALGEIVKAEAGILETDTPATSLGKLAASLEPLLESPDERAWVSGRLAPLVGSETEAVAEKQERFAAWSRYLAALAEQRPTVMIIEDLHWADPNLVEFLSDLPETTSGSPLLLVCTARPDYFESHPTWGAGQRNSITIHLDPLDGEATARLLDELLEDEDLDESLRTTVLERSGGNPLWAQEFVRMLRDRDAKSSELAVPDTVQAVVASRIDLLEGETKAVLQAAAAVGKSFWLGAVQEILGTPEPLGDSMRELVRRSLVRPERTSTVAGESEYAFTHALIREVAFGQTPRRVRIDRHHTVARWIERMAGERIGDRAGVIAHHDAEALRLAVEAELDDVTPFTEAALTSHRRAAEQAARLDMAAARSHLEAALDLALEGDPRRASLLYELGAVVVKHGDLDAAKKILLEAADEADRIGDVETWGMCMASLDQLFWIAGDVAESDRLGSEAVARLEQHPPGRALARVYAARAGRLWLRGDAGEETLAFVDRVRPVVEVHGDNDARRRLLSAEGGARFDNGDPSGMELFRRVVRMAIEADDSLGIGGAYLNLGEQLRTGWGLKEAMPVHERGAEIAVQRRTGGVEQFVRYSLAQDHFLVGQWEQSLDQVETVLSSPERLPYLVGGFEATRLVIQACRGELPPDAAAEIARLMEYAAGIDDMQTIIPSWEAAVWVYLMMGDDDRAADLARDLVERAGSSRFLLDSWGLPLWLLNRAGRLDLFEPLRDGLRSFDLPVVHTLVGWLDGLRREADDREAAFGAITEVADRLRDFGHVVWTVIALSDAARIADDLGDTDAAGAARAMARAHLDGQGAEPLLGRLGL
jgi:class 3 adenylate cyclase/tetratricopeptide (TPR) repeat protein